MHAQTLDTRPFFPLPLRSLGTRLACFRWIVSLKLNIGASERAVIVMAKKSEICLGHENFQRCRIEFKPFRNQVAIVCLP